VSMNVDRREKKAAEDRAAAAEKRDQVDPVIEPEVPLTGKEALRAGLLNPPDGAPRNEPPYEE
jgi:hypothetical protein